MKPSNLLVRFPSLLFLAGAALALTATSARSDVVSFSPDGSSAPLTIMALNFEAGNAVAMNGDNLVKGATIQFYFQTTLGSVTLSNGSVFTPAGLNSTGAGGYQITMVASLTETVSNVFTGPQTTTFALASVQSPNSFVEIYQNSAVVANPFQGTGYNVGTNILSVTPNPALPSSGNFTYSETSGGVPVIQPFDQTGSGRFPGVNTVVGSGSTSIGGNVISQNSNFFLNSIQRLTFNALESTPFQAVDPSKLFAAMPGGVPPSFTPNIGTTNGLASGGGTDFQFQSQAGTTFFVPEPSGAALIGIGLVGLVGYGVKRKGRTGFTST